MIKKRDDRAGDEYIPFGKPNFSEEEIEAVAETLRTGWIGNGPQTIAFEEELATFLGAPHVVTVNSCTSALFLSLLIKGVGQDDEVICPSLTWCSTANAALYLGAKPVFCDVDPETYCVTPENILEKLTPDTKAVIVVHMGGLAVEVEPIREVLPEGVALIEDAAHALGSRFADGRPVGSSGNPTCFSFYANKNLSTADGGAIALFDEKEAMRLLSLRQHAMPVDAWKRYSNPSSLLYSPLSELGYKMHFTDLQASIGRVQLRRQAEFHETRLNIARRYRDRLKRSAPEVKLQRNISHPSHARHLFLIQLDERHPQRDELALELRARNIGAGIHYASLHGMALYDSREQPSLPNTEAISRNILTLPISASMSLEEADYVIDHLIELLGEAPARYGFHGRLSARFPSQIIVDNTELCNLACTHCAHSSFRRSEGYEGACLSPELNAKMVDEVREIGRGITQYIRYTGNGEPLLDRGIYEKLEYAVRNSGVTVTLTTNGTLMNRERARRLLETGVDVIDISIDAFTPETYARIRVKGDLVVTRKNVLNLIAMKKDRTKVVVSYIEQEQNIHETGDFERFWKEQGADRVVVRRLHSNAGAGQGAADLMRRAMAGVQRRPCLYPWERITLNPHGRLGFCPDDWVGGSAVPGADYREVTIEQVWQGDFYRKLREAHLVNDYSGHAFCGQCPDWANTSWPGEGQSYANMIEAFKDADRM